VTAAGTRRSLAVLCVLGAAGLGAGSAGGAASSKLYRLGAGDQFSIKGTALHCAISASMPVTTVCGLGTASPRPGTYAFAVADSALLVLKASSAGTPVEVKREPEPRGSGPTFPGVSAAGHTITVGLNAVVTVGGTHVFCAVERQGGQTFVTCGPATASASFFVKSYVGAVSAHTLYVIQKLDQKRTRTALTEHEP
jgi:hypothetical protein